jgi:hypothetical protein
MKKIQLILLFSASVLISACVQHNAAADEAIKALRKIDAATQVGVNLTTYNELLIEAKVNEADRTLPDGDLKTDLDIAMFAYVEAARDWNQYGKHGGEILEYHWETARESLGRISAASSKAGNKRRETIKGINETKKQLYKSK